MLTQKKKIELYKNIRRFKCIHYIYCIRHINAITLVALKNKKNKNSKIEYSFDFVYITNC